MPNRSRLTTRMTAGLAAVVAALLSLTLWLLPQHLAAATPRHHPHPQSRQLDASLEWYPGVREQLQTMINEQSTCRRGHPARPRIAIFDWDNTVVKNDVMEATVYWMLRHDKILAPPALNWKRTSPYMTDAAAAALAKACNTHARPGVGLRTRTNTGCADEILAIYAGKTRAGQTAFDGYDRRRVSANGLWGHGVPAGYTNRQLTQMAKQVMRESLKAPVGAKQIIGTTQVEAYVHVYPQVKDLIATLRANGIQPWVISGSPEPVVELWATKVNIPARHVIGSRAILRTDGRRTYHEQGCGGSPRDTAVPTIDGKRCWANQEIFGVKGPRAWQPLNPSRRQVFAAGDSVADVTFMREATAGRLTINRNGVELMCHAYDNTDGNWVINPMFLEPRGKLNGLYPCTTGATDTNGNPVPVTRDDGTPIPNQEDTIYGTP